MPNYEYECTSCGHRFEQLQGMNDQPLRKCPECGEKVRRLISGGGGVIFSAKGGSASGRKGSGFHATDYPKKKSEIWYLLQCRPAMRPTETMLR